MSNIQDSTIDSFLGSLEKTIEGEGMGECCRCVIAFLIENGFIKPSQIRAYMVGVLYEKIKPKAKSKTEALNQISAILEIDEKQVRNILGNLPKYKLKYIK